MEKGKEEAKDKKKTLSKNQKKIIIKEVFKNIGIIILLAIMIFAFVECVKANIEYAKGDNVNPNLLTVISGWLGFAATAIVGIITIIQNRRYEYNTYKQNRVDNLRADREMLYACYNRFIDMSLYDRINELLQIKGQKSDKEARFELEKLKIMRDIKQLYCQSLNFMYNFDKVIALNKQIKELLRFLAEDINNISDLENKGRTLIEYIDNIDNLFAGTLLTVKVYLDDFIRTRKFKTFFEAEMTRIEDVDEYIEELEKTKRKETQNGQAKDDVNGQDK